MLVESRQALFSYQDYHMFCVSSEDRPVLRTGITTCCCSRARRFHLATSEDQLADIMRANKQGVTPINICALRGEESTTALIRALAVEA